MSFRSLALFALLGLSYAKPAPTVLQHDDVLVLRSDGQPLVMKSWDYKIEEDKREVQRRKANKLPRVAAPSPKTDKRCEQSTEVQVLTDSYFNDWDVAMSPVISNTGSASALVAVSKGYSLTNTVTVSTSVSAVFEAFLTVSMGIDVSESWTTTDTQTYTFSVPEGQYGVVVSNPNAHRLTGNVLSGCTDSPTSEPFVSDSYTSESFGSLSWVTGPIGLCNSSTYPVPFCVGTGTHS